MRQGTFPADKLARNPPRIDAPEIADPAFFLDRDGTIIVDAHYPKDPEQVCLVPGAAAALRQLAEWGFALVVVSNQSGIGRGLVTPAEAAAVHERFVALLAEQGVRLAGSYYCPHGPAAGCACRKPLPGMLRQAAAELRLDLARSFMVGDKESDLEAGQAAGCRTIWFAGDGKDQILTITPDAVARDWPTVTRLARQPRD